MFICLDLESFFLELSEGSWELDACHRLISGLTGALSQINFLRMWSCRLTPAVRLWQLQHIPIKYPLSLPAVSVWDTLCLLLFVRRTCSTSPFASISSWAAHSLINPCLPWSAMRTGSIRFLCGGRPGLLALCSKQSSHWLVGHKLLVDECLAKWLVGHSSRMIAWPKSIS